jgi:hypothetical protein
MNHHIAIIFDFDQTLTDDSTSGFLESLGIDAADFWSRSVGPLLEEGWDPIPAYLYRMIEQSNQGSAGERITQQRLADWGRQISFYPGVHKMFSTLRKTAAAVDDALAVEFYLISSGIGEILRASRVAKEFKDIWACEFHYGQRGEIVYPKNIVSFTEKTRYLFQVSKGIVGPDSRMDAAQVNKKVADGFRMPFSQMIVIGDGMTDVPCFSLVNRYGGIAIGVYQRDLTSRWGKAWQFVADQRVASLHQTNYSSSSDLMNSLVMAVQQIAGNIVG